MDSVLKSIRKVDGWIRRSEYRGYEPFDGLSSPWARKLTLGNSMLRIGLQQTVRRLPFNLRPLLRITPKRCNQAMGYFAAGYLRLYQATGEMDYLEQAVMCLNDLLQNTSPGYSGAAWGWCFDYQSRGDFLPQGEPTVVWTSFIAHAFLDAYDLLKDARYLETAESVCRFILMDLPRGQSGQDSLCISYVPHMLLEIHNSNMLAASVLARVYRHTQDAQLLETAEKAVRYTMKSQHEDGSWWYGEGFRWHWVDGYHTGFVLDTLYSYIRDTGDEQYIPDLVRGMDFYRSKMFDGVVCKHYNNGTYPIDIQSISQAIQTFAFIPKEFHGDIDWSYNLAGWAIEKMQDPNGYFYFRKLKWTIDKTPFLHWGQGTMLAALALLFFRMKTDAKENMDSAVEKESP